MKSTTQPQAALLQKFRRLLPEAELNDMARDSGFMQRRPRKLTPFYFVLSFFLALGGRTTSLSGWAAQLSAVSGQRLAKQSLDERLSEAGCRFARRLLEHLLRLRLAAQKELNGTLGAFGSVLLQDSTTLSLQPPLKEAFKGNVSRGVQRAVVRLKAIVELRTLQLLQLSSCPYSHNDQAAASNVHRLVRKGTLVLRDLGYWSLDSLGKIARRKAFFLSRLRYGTHLYDLAGRPLCFKELLKAQAVDRWVLLGQESHLKVRIIITALSASLAEQRIRKAKKDRDRRLRHSPGYYAFLRYRVFITNAPCKQLPARAAARLYGLRWQIEIFFKGLKSRALHLDEVVRPVRQSAQRVTIAITLALCLVVLTARSVYQPFKDLVVQACQKYLSFGRVVAWVCQNLTTFALLNQQQLQLCLQQYCCYEKRKRINLAQKIENTNLTLMR